MSGFLDLMGATAGALALIDRLAENPASRKGSKVRSYPNIEKSAFKKGAYVGYGHNSVYMITGGSGYWRATRQSGNGPATLSAASLGEMSAALELKDNPRARKTAKRAPIKRAGIPAKKYAARPSQITRAKPSKRLKARRAVHIASGMPVGVFPNPARKADAYPYKVMSLPPGKKTWKPVAQFATASEAIAYTKAAAVAKPTHGWMLNDNGRG